MVAALSHYAKMHMRIKAAIIFIIIFFSTAFSQEAVYFYSSDSTIIKADLYLKNYSYPFILLFHQQGSNRNEFHQIAPRLLNLNYNCLAVDIRNEFINNQFIKEKQESEVSLSSFDYFNGINDINEAIEYIQNFNKKPVILLGSAISASLCIIAANNNPDVGGVVALSPGDYFSPGGDMKNEINGFKKPLFIASSWREYDYIESLFEHIKGDNIKLFRPSGGQGAQGSKALLESNATNEEYWLELLLFFTKLNKDNAGN